MNYSNIYNLIIQNAKTLKRSKAQNYFENHHIVPRCFGGDNSKQNLVLLTAREHFLCHYLLVKIQLRDSREYHQMLHAFMLMKGMNLKQNRYVNSRMYEALKKDYASYSSTKRKGASLSSNHKEKISKSMRGHVVSDETRAIISHKASTRQRKPFSQEYRQRMSNIMKKRNRWV